MMSKEIMFDFEYEARGKKLVIVSLNLNGKNNYRVYFKKLEEPAKKRFLKITERMANHLGFEVQNRSTFEWLKGYNKLGEIKTHNPGHRILVTNFYCIENFMILLLGFPKRSNESGIIIRNQYKKAEEYIKIIREDEDDLRKKLRTVLGGIY